MGGLGWGHPGEGEVGSIWVPTHTPRQSPVCLGVPSGPWGRRTAALPGKFEVTAQCGVQGRAGPHGGASGLRGHPPGPDDSHRGLGACQGPWGLPGAHRGPRLPCKLAVRAVQPQSGHRPQGRQDGLGPWPPPGAPQPHLSGPSELGRLQSLPVTGEVTRATETPALLGLRPDLGP